MQSALVDGRCFAPVPQFQLPSAGGTFLCRAHLRSFRFPYNGTSLRPSGGLFLPRPLNGLSCMDRAELSTSLMTSARSSWRPPLPLVALLSLYPLSIWSCQWQWLCCGPWLSTSGPFFFLTASGTNLCHSSASTRTQVIKEVWSSLSSASPPLTTMPRKASARFHRQMPREVLDLYIEEVGQICHSNFLEPLLTG